jgi:hypothetical protein
MAAVIDLLHLTRYIRRSHENLTQRAAPTNHDFRSSVASAHRRGPRSLLTVMKSSASSQSVGHAKKNARATRSRRSASAAQLDARFDAGENISEYIDWANATRPGRTVQRVNVDFPVDVLAAIDREADRLGVTRQAFIKVRVADSLTAAANAPIARRRGRAEKRTAQKR